MSKFSLVFDGLQASAFCNELAAQGGFTHGELGTKHVSGEVISHLIANDEV